MIVIEKKYLPEFNTEKNKIKTLLEAAFVDIVPIEIKNDLFILPEEVLNNNNFKPIFDNFTSYTKREINQDEFINTSLI